LDYLWAPSDVQDIAIVKDDGIAVPDWLGQPAPQLNRDQRPISPSRLSGPKALPGDGLDQSTAKLRGTRIHLLLEHLPSLEQGTRVKMARKLLAQSGHIVSDAELGDLVAEVIPLLSQDDLAHIFAPDTLSEVGITAPSSAHDMRPIDGIIDRLIITEKTVIAVDFKSNAVVPSTPELVPSGVLAQMGAYLVALNAVYPDRQIELAILWTKNAHYMSVPHDLVTAAFHTASVT
jgi:ATP-dependent helicase/nuclease subunit A